MDDSIIARPHNTGLAKVAVQFTADDEKELGMNPVIASLSFGASRNFQLQHRFQKSIPKQSIALNDASLLVMQGETQHFWKHQIPKQKNKGPRINLTFRKIIY